jgi:hypothetical protein
MLLISYPTFCLVGGLPVGLDDPVTNQMTDKDGYGRVDHRCGFSFASNAS